MSSSNGQLGQDLGAAPRQIERVRIDNGGAGNCMYYAYSISLMYYLHAKKDGNITENVFNNLDIQGQDRDTLNALISKSEKFTPEDLQSIQGIIAPKARALAAKATKDSFLAENRGGCV